MARTPQHRSCIFCFLPRGSRSRLAGWVTRAPATGCWVAGAEHLAPTGICWNLAGPAAGTPGKQRCEQEAGPLQEGGGRKGSACPQHNQQQKCNPVPPSQVGAAGPPARCAGPDVEAAAPQQRPIEAGQGMCLHVACRCGEVSLPRCNDRAQRCGWFGGPCVSSQDGENRG